MGYVAVTVPAGHALAALGQHVVDAPRFDKLRVELCVTTDAVVHDYFRAGGLGTDGLMLGVGDKVSHMLHAINALEAIMSHYIAMGHVTIVARGVTPMRRMRPGSVVRGHDMAVDTSGRIVAGNIGVHSQQVEKEECQTYYRATYNQQKNLLAVAENVFPCYQFMPIHRLTD